MDKDFALVLDFDGVICDSVDECHLSALNAWNRVYQVDSRYITLADLEPERVERFRACRYIARNAAEFWLIVYLTYKHDGEVSGEVVQALRTEYSKEINRFSSPFFQAREEVRAADSDGWLRLHRLYPQFLDGWEMFAGHEHIYVVTTKDASSVHSLLQHWSINIPMENLWTKEKGIDKAEAIQHLADQSGLATEKVVFVDDHLHHLEAVSRKGAQCYHASWGYTGDIKGKPPSIPSIASLSDLHFLICPHSSDHS